MVNDSDLTSWVNNLRDETIWRNAKILLRSTDDQIVVLMDGKSRYVIARKDGIIYGCKNLDINKKECYGPLSGWRDWDWSGYYPFRKDLYAWQEAKRKGVSIPRKKVKRKRKTGLAAAAGKREPDTATKAGDWPYTTGDRSEIRRPRSNRKKLGGERVAEGGSEASGNKGDHCQDHKREE